MTIRERVIAAFEQQYNRAPDWLIRAPGRVNLIGEHTDYNDGFVLPMAIDRAVWIAVHPRKDNRVQLYSLDFDQSLDFDLDDFSRMDSGWGEYVKGTAWALKENGYLLAGWEGIIAGDIPIGAGLSSSAAIELATAKVFSLVSGFDWEPKRVAGIAQRAENDWVGVNCGIMDQMIVAAGEPGRALLIDCRSLDLRAVPLPEETLVVILDTTTRRGLVDSAYNERREQCEEAAAFFGVPALRDVSLERFRAEGGDLVPVTRKRARHIITENRRVLQAVQALESGDAATFGELIDQSHASLRHDFEVSRRELDVIVALAQTQPGCYGARMTGAGFGGCAVALVKSGQIDPFVDSLSRSYHQQTSLTPEIYITAAAPGVQAVNPPG